MISSIKLAKLCNVSQGTVDRALHGRGRVSPETRDRILRAAERYGYAPNPAARELMTGTSALAGAVIPAVNSIFFMDLMEELRRAIAPQGLRLIITAAQNAAETMAVLREFAARRLRAVCLVSPDEETVVPAAFTRIMPVISLINPVAGRNVRFVAPDETRTGASGAEYLRSQGHRRILFLSYPRRSWAMISREQGYAAAMRKAGAQPHILKDVTETSLMKAVSSFKPTALFCHNDWLALNAMRILGRHGITVPQEISVLGIDNSPSFCALHPELTTMEYPCAGVAARVAGILAGKKGNDTVKGGTIMERRTVEQLNS